jgi:hypothetical protein
MKTLNEKLIDAIISHLPQKGDPCQAVSYLRTCLYQDGWKGLGSCLADFETMCEDLGFTVRKGKNSRGQTRTEVTL